MRIAMLCSSHPVTDSRVTHKEAVSLAKAGHEVTVFGLQSGAAFEASGVRLQPVAPAGAGLWRRAKTIPALTRAAVDSAAELLICHEPESALAGLLARRKTGAKVWFDVHEAFHETLSGRMHPWFGKGVRRLSVFALRAIARRVDWVTVVSPAIGEFYRTCRNDSRVDLIANSPRPDRFPPCRHEEGGDVIVCHEGFLNSGRGMVEMLLAVAGARRQANVRLLLLGEVHPPDRELFDRTVRRLGAAAWIEGPAWVPYSQLGAAVARAQIGLVAMQPTVNNYLGLSNKIFSYMACGQPAIVPRGSATAELVRQEDCGIAVDTTDPRQIADAIVTLARDSRLRVRLGANGRRAVEQKHGWHCMERRLHEIAAVLQREIRPGVENRGALMVRNPAAESPLKNGSRAVRQRRTRNSTV